MAKGKYAARTANREVARDNEIIIEKMAEIDHLTQELADTQRLLAEERRERGAIIIARADDLARHAIEKAQQQSIDALTAHQETRRYVAEWVTDYIDRLAKINPGIDLFITEVNVHEFLASLVGDGQVGDYLRQWMTTALSEKFSARRYRRATNKVMDDRRRENPSKPALVGQLKMDRGLTPTVGEQVALEQQAFLAAENLALLVHKPWEKSNDERGQ